MQSKDILRWLQAGKTIGPMLALVKFNCMRLAARIHDLRAAGNEIATLKHELKSGKTVARYRLIKAK